MAPLLAWVFLLVATAARAEATDPVADAEPALPPAPVSGPERADEPAAVDEGPLPPAEAPETAPEPLSAAQQPVETLETDLSAAEVAPPAPSPAPTTPAPEPVAAPPVHTETTLTPVPLPATSTPEEAPGPRLTHPTTVGTGRESGTLPRLGARLRALQGYLARVRRRLANGGEPPRRTFRQLRRTLEAVTPAVEERVDGGPRGAARLRAVRKRVRRARASADAVIVLLRRSELRGPEVRRLLPWLVRFRAPVAVLAPQPATTEPDRLVVARTSAQPAYTQADAPQAPLQSEIEAERRGRAEPATRRARDTRRAPPPRRTKPGGGGTAAAGSSSFSSSGGQAVLALPPSLRPPRILRRPARSPGGRHEVPFVAPLERPG